MLAAAALEQAGIAKIDENLLEELVRDGVARRDLGARQRLAIGHLGNREQRPERIAGLVGDHRTNPSENMGNLAEFGIAVTSRTPGSPATRRSGSTPAEIGRASCRERVCQYV